MAPSVLLQMVGPRVANHVLETLHEAFPERFPLSQTLANFAEGSDEIVVRGERRRTSRADPRRRAGGDRRRGAAPARGGRRRRARRTSTRRCCSARASRSGSAGSRSSSTRPASRSAWSAGRSPRWAPPRAPEPAVLPVPGARATLATRWASRLLPERDLSLPSAITRRGSACRERPTRRWRASARFALRAAPATCSPSSGPPGTPQSSPRSRSSGAAARAIATAAAPGGKARTIRRLSPRPRCSASTS